MGNANSGRRPTLVIGVGQRFGRGVVKDIARLPLTDRDRSQGRKSGRRVAVMQCDCGNEYARTPDVLHKGASVSCGCAAREAFRDRSIVYHANGGNAIHGLHGTPNYKRWASIKSRCHAPSDQNYKNYGARGIAIADEWFFDAEAFCVWIEENLGPCPEGWSLDRINNDGNYEPGNLRWADHFTQNNNHRKGGGRPRRVSA